MGVGQKIKGSFRYLKKVLECWMKVGGTGRNTHRVVVWVLQIYACDQLSLFGSLRSFVLKLPYRLEEFVFFQI